MAIYGRIGMHVSSSYMQAGPDPVKLLLRQQAIVYSYMASY